MVFPPSKTLRGSKSAQGRWCKNMTKKIPLTQGKFALVDDEDFEYLSQWKWHASKYSNSYYACRTINSNKVLMHRFILNAQKELEVDHIDGNGLNNQKLNLRIVTHSRNMQNRKNNSNNKSGYKGVFFNKREKRWMSQIGENGKKKHL